MLPDTNQKVVSTIVNLEHDLPGRTVLANIADIHQASIKIVLFHQVAKYAAFFSTLISPPQRRVANRILTPG